EKREGYKLFYTQQDGESKKEYLLYIKRGIDSVRNFFGSEFKKEFEVYVHSSRNSLDAQWRKDWNMPEFKSECWMVASGVAAKLDMLSPQQWAKESCEHDYTDKLKTQQIITHELVHVFHGQLNVSPDFSNVTGLDWFVEGLATYASAQLDQVRITEISKAVSENKFPNSLDNFWTGKLKYGLSGSIVKYIDQKYGRRKLIELLKFNRKNEILGALETTETDLLDGWKKYFEKSN
ncbi:MAG: hypothetical protein Q8L04_10970, partial [Ignavibacteria bacterium]|nr:hypothetical protein [Ignavibacteria bacterium]